MDLEKKVWRLNSYLRGQLPASVVEDVVRKLAFTYYLYIKLFRHPAHDDLDRTVDELVNALKHPEELITEDGVVPEFLYRRGVHGPKDELIDMVRSGLNDYYFYSNDGSHSTDSMQITLLFNEFNAEELLGIVNMSFENSIRDESTPDSVSELVLKLASLYQCSGEVVTDMTCGTGAFLLEAAKYFKRVEGVEINKDNVLIARARLLVNQISGEIRQANCFEDSWHHQSRGSRSDLVFAEFPWKLIIKDYAQKEIMLNCNANRLYLSPNSTTDYFFLSAMMNYLKPEGVAITVMPLSSLSNLADRSVREHIIKRGFLREVIALPANIFGRTGVATAIVVMGLKPCEKVCFFDGSQYFVQEKRRTNAIDVNKLLADLAKAKETGECYITEKEMKDHDYSFSPAHYLKKVEKTIPNATELVNLADIFTGWQVPSAKLEVIHKTDGTGTRLLQMSNVENGSIVSKLERYDIPENTIEKFKVQRGDVVISTKSLKVKSAVVDLNTDEPIVAAGSIMVIRPKERMLDPYYLVAYFESDLGKQVLEMYQTGNVIPNLSINNVKKIPVPGLLYDRQVRIGQEYMDLRDLIRSEKERLRALESKANKMLDNLWDSEEGE